MAPDGNEPIRMEAARRGLCPGMNAKGLLKEEEEESKAVTRSWLRLPSESLLAQTRRSKKGGGQFLVSII